MVNVRVAQHQRIDGRRIKWKVQIALVGIGSSTLIEAALQQNASIIDLQQVH
jgi:hypothetical protein